MGRVRISLANRLSRIVSKMDVLASLLPLNKGMWDGTRRSGFHVVVDLVGQPIRAVSQGMLLQLDPAICCIPGHELRMLVQWSANSLVLVKQMNWG
jgi:hypothetical protein